MLKRKSEFENGIMIALAMTAALAVALPDKANAAPEVVDGTLGSDANSIDIYQVYCASSATAQTSRLSASVKDGAGISLANIGPEMVVVKSVFGDIRRDTTEDASASPDVNIAAGNGLYTVLIHKSSVKSSLTGVEDYTATFRCQYVDQNNTIFDTTTGQYLLQDQ